MATVKNPRKPEAATKPRNESVDAQVVERYHPNSRANRIAELGIGESVSEAKRLDLDNTNKAEVDEASDNLKSTMSKAAVLATKRSGYTFTTEVGQFITRSGDIIVTAVVTRTA